MSYNGEFETIEEIYIESLEQLCVERAKNKQISEDNSYITKEGFIWRMAQRTNVFGRHILDKDANPLFLFSKIDVLFHYVVMIVSFIVIILIINHEYNTSKQINYAINENPNQVITSCQYLDSNWDYEGYMINNPTECVNIYHNIIGNSKYIQGSGELRCTSERTDNSKIIHITNNDCINFGKQINEWEQINNNNPSCNLHSVRSKLMCYNENIVDILGGKSEPCEETYLRYCGPVLQETTKSTSTMLMNILTYTGSTLTMIIFIFNQIILAIKFTYANNLTKPKDDNSINSKDIEEGRYHENGKVYIIPPSIVDNQNKKDIIVKK